MRFKIAEGSTSGHCCFRFTVVDTTRPELIGGEHYRDNGEPQYESVCECFNAEDARAICDALNAHKQPGE